MLLADLCADYLAGNPAIRSPHTERLLHTSVSHFGRFLARPPFVNDLSDKRLTAYIRHRQQLGMAAATVEREAAKLLTLARYGAARGLVDLPLLRIEKAPPAVPIAFLRGEVRQLFRAASRYHATIGGVPGNLVLVALLSVIWDTAERIGALCEVHRSEIDLRGRWITITSRKNSGRTLVRRLSRSTVRELRKLLAASTHDKPFGFVHRGSLYHHLASVLRDAGLPDDRRHKFHCLRRSHASYLHAAGGDARESLDHADSRTTRDHYFDPRIVGMTNAIGKLFSPFGWWHRMLAAMGW